MTYTVDRDGRRRLSTTKLLALVGSAVGVSATLGKCGYDYVTSSLTGVNARVERIETALLPILVEFRLQQEMDRLGIHPQLESNLPPPSILRESAEKWASEQVGQKTKGG